MVCYMSDTAAAILYSTAEEKLVQQKVILFQRSCGLKIRNESKIAKTYGFLRTLNLALLNVSQIRSNPVMIEQNSAESNSIAALLLLKPERERR